MKKYSIVFLLILPMVFITSCLTEIEFDSKTLEPKLVINSINMVDSVFKVEVTSSKLIPGPDTSYIRGISDARVVLKADNQEAEELVLSNSITGAQGYSVYKSVTTKVEAGKQYSIEVSHPDYKTVSCTVEIPQRIEVLRFDTVTVPATSSDESSKIKVTIRFTDPTGVKNFYRLNVFKKRGYYYERTVYDQNGMPTDSIIPCVYIDNEQLSNIESDDPVFNQHQDMYSELFGSSGNDYNLFTDDLIDGKTYELSFYIDSYIVNQMKETDYEHGGFFRLNIELYTLSEEAYWYIKSVGESSDYMSFILSEPVQVYSNIENGLGIFGGCSLFKQSYQKGDYPIDGIDYQDSWSYYSF